MNNMDLLCYKLKAVDDLMWHAKGVIETEDGGEFKVHLDFIAALSPFIKQMMHSLPAAQPVKRVFIPSIDKSTMETIISYAYTGKIFTNIKGIKNLIIAADMLGFKSIVNICLKYIIVQQNERNCIEIYNFANEFKCDYLLLTAKKFILANFGKIYSSSSLFLEFSAEDLEMFLRSDELNVPNEETCFRAIIKWVEHKPSERQQYLPNLLGAIRFGFCSQEFYEQNINIHPFILESQDCQNVLYQVSMVFLDMNSVTPPQHKPIDAHHPLVRPRIPHDILFVIGGWSNGSATNVIETYDVRAGRWFLSVHADTMPRAYHGLASLKGLLYMIGGFDGNQCFNTVRCFDPELQRWSEKSCMFVARCYISVTTTDEYIYALGGYDGHTRVSSAERYDHKRNQWYQIEDMHQIRSDASATELDGKIYIAGGFNGQQVLNTAEVYCPSTNSWTLIPDMSTPRSGVNLISYNNYIYVVGGFNGTSRLSTMERYDHRTRQWILMPPMSIPRSNFATATLEGKLYAIGGFNGLTTVSHVECYNSETNQWQPVADMNVNRSALSACIMEGLSNGNEYSFLGSAARRMS